MSREIAPGDLLELRHVTTPPDAVVMMYYVVALRGGLVDLLMLGEGESHTIAHHVLRSLLEDPTYSLWFASEEC